jgi:hypothetical protein
MVITGRLNELHREQWFYPKLSEGGTLPCCNKSDKDRLEMLKIKVNSDKCAEAGKMSIKVRVPILN